MRLGTRSTSDKDDRTGTGYGSYATSIEAEEADILRIRKFLERLKVRLLLVSEWL